MRTLRAVALLWQTFVSGIDVPEPDHKLAASRDKCLTVGREGHRVDPTLMRGELPQLFAACATSQR